MEEGARLTVDELDRAIDVLLTAIDADPDGTLAGEDGLRSLVDLPAVVDRGIGWERRGRPPSGQPDSWRCPAPAPLRKQVLFLDARQVFRQVDRAHREFTEGGAIRRHRGRRA